MIDRFLQNTVATATATFDIDGDATAVTNGLVTITRADGTVPVSAGGVVPTGNTGQVSYTLNTSQTGLLDRLRYLWTATVNGVPQSIVTWADIVGGFILSLSDLKAVYPSASSDQLAFMRAVAEERLEAACGRALVPRFRVEKHQPRNGRIRITHADDFRALRFVTQGTYSWSPEQLLNAYVRGSCLYGPYQWTGAPVVVGYEYGDDAPSNEAQQVALIVAQEEFPEAGQERDPRIIRQESDNQLVWWAPPTSSNPFVSTRANQFVKSYGPMLA